MQHYQVTATYTNGMAIRRIVVADSAETALQRFETVCTDFGISHSETDWYYSLDISAVPTPSGYWTDAAYQEALALMEQHNVYLHMVTREATAANLYLDDMTPEEFFKFRHDLAADDTGMNEPEWVLEVYETLEQNR